LNWVFPCYKDYVSNAVKPRYDTDRGSGSRTLNIENHVIDILVGRLSPHYDEVSLEGGLIEKDLDLRNEQPRLQFLSKVRSYGESYYK
jgi:hypothetical protein